MALARYRSIFLVFSAVTFVISVESSLTQNANVVYSRWVRRRPVEDHKNIYFDEVREVFHTRRRPPPFAFLNDETLTRFVRCDYDPSLPECDESGVRTTSVKPESASTFRTTTTTTRATTTTAMAPSTTSTTRSPWIYTTRTTVRTPWIDAPTTTSTTSTTSTTPPTTSTTTTPNSIPERTEAPTTEELPLLPDIEDDNQDDYTENEDSPTSIKEEEHTTNVDYLNYDANEVEDEAAEEEGDDYLTEDNEVEKADGDSDIVESAALTQETTTAKSKPRFSWF